MFVKHVVLCQHLIRHAIFGLNISDPSNKRIVFELNSFWHEPI